MIALTGATGFVGREVLRQAIATRLPIRALLRNPTPIPDVRDSRVVGDLSEPMPGNALEGCQVVIHCAARAHVLNDASENPEAAFLRANCDAAIAVAESAVMAGVKRMVFVSSIKVLGERTLLGQPFRPEDSPAPMGPYGRSKAAAERELKALAARTGLELVIVRSPLVSGAGAKGHLAQIVQAVRRRLPLPLNGITNRRSMVHVSSLADLLLEAASHPKAAGQTLHAADHESLSTPAIIRAVALGLGTAPLLFSVPSGVLRLTARLTGRDAMMSRLIGSLEVDGSTSGTLLSWRPRVSAEDGLRLMGEAAR